MSLAKEMVSTAKDFRRPPNSVHLGKVKGSLWRQEWLTEGQLNHHVHIVGASGFGKTVLISHIIRQRIEQGRGVLFIDLKSDMNTILKFSQFAAEANRLEDLRVFSLSDLKMSHRYNLLGNGTANQLRDRIMMALNWSEEFYKNQAASFLLKLLIGLCWLRDHAGHSLNLGVVLRAASDPRFLEDLACRLPETAVREKRIFEDCVRFAKSSDQWGSLQGLRTQLENICLSDFGELIVDEGPGIDLFDAVRKGHINYVFLDSRRYGETAKAIGRFILQDLKAVSARIDAEVPESERIPFTVIIDEFADMASEDFIAFLDRARSSKMSIVVAHQEICDLERISREFAGRLMGNMSTLYAFLQKRPESAEIIAGMAGTRTVRESTEQYERRLMVDWPTGMKSVKTVEGFVIHPNLIKKLRVGTCVCVKKYPEARGYLVNVAP